VARRRSGEPRQRGSAIHQGLVGERELVGTPYLADPELRREYEREIAPRTRAALGKILPEVFPAGTAAPSRALDLGAGTGAATEALRAFFGAPLEITGVDRVAAPGVVKADLGVALPPVEGRFDLIVAAHLLGELYVHRPHEERIDARARRVRAWADALLAPGGTLVLVEPALRETSRAFLHLRDRLVAQGAAVVAPCFYRGDCPALVRESDWCHAERPFAPPPAIAELAVAAKLHRDSLKMSYLVLRARNTAWPEPPDGRVFRIVSEPLDEKGKRRRIGCGPEGRIPLVLPDKHLAETNRVFDELQRGDVIRVSEVTTRGDGLRLERGSRVERLARAGEPNRGNLPQRNESSPSQNK